MPDLSQLTHGTSGQQRSFPCSEPVHALEFSPFSEGSSALIAVGGESRVTVGQFTENPDDDGGSALSSLIFEPVLSLRHESRVQALAWSPACVNRTPGYTTFNFCSAGSDHRVHCFHGDARQPSVQTMPGHTSYVNSCAYDPDGGRRIATVSDDRTCRIWDVMTGQCITQLPLTSAGMAVCWNPAEPLKLLVAERRGLLRVYDLVSEKPLMSLETGQAPLLDADWSLTNSLLAGAVAGGSAYVWDLSRGRWCRISDQMYGTMGCPPHQVKVHLSNSQKVPISHSLAVAGGLSWHPNLPLCAVGGDSEIHVWDCGL